MLPTRFIASFIGTTSYMGGSMNMLKLFEGLKDAVNHRYNADNATGFYRPYPNTCNPIALSKSPTTADANPQMAKGFTFCAEPL